MTAKVSNQQLSCYIGSAGYHNDLEAARLAWSVPTVLETAGALVFLTYLSLPVLLAVRPPSGTLARSVLDGERERTFLLRVLGLDNDAAWSGGIQNARTRHLVTSMGRYHSRFRGIRPEYLDFIAATIALSPLRVRAQLGSCLPAADRTGYWRYISQVLSAFGACLETEKSASLFCDAFTSEHAQRSADGQELFLSLDQRHPRYVRLAIPSLFDASRFVVGSLLEDAA